MNFSVMKINSIMKRILILTAGWLMTAGSVQAQQIPLYSQYFFNQFIYNPAQTGLSGSPQLYFIYRKQWVGFEGSPETRALTFDMPIAQNKAGIGAYLFSDVTNIFRKNGGYFSYAYHLNFKEKHKLSIGLSAGLQENRIDFAKVFVKDQNDAIITNNIQRAVTVDGAAGINYSFKGLNIGFSYIDTDKKMGYRLSRHYLGTFSYRFSMAGDKFSITPLAVFRTSETFAFQFDAGANFMYKDFVWLGAMFRYNAAVAVAGGFRVHKLVSVGYSYDLSVNSLAGYNSGSHEVMLGFTFGKRGKAEDELKKELEEKFKMQDSLMNNLQKQIDSLANITDSMARITDSLDIRVDSLENLAAQGKLGGATDNMSPEQMEEFKKQLDQMKQQMADSLKTIEQKMMQLKNAESSSERTKIIPREDIEHVDGPPLGDYYLVVGSFKIKDNSFKFKKQLEEKGYKIGIVYNKKRNWYYVYMAQASDSKGGLEELYNLREQKKDEFSDAWIYILR
jgi:type IX secretion system PorP/SprF family membrane protein